MNVSRHDALLDLLRERGAVKTADAVLALGVSRMTAYRRLRELVDEGAAVSVGSGPQASYALSGLRVRFSSKGLDEHAVAKRVEPTLRALFALSGPDAAAINFALTEMVNNAIDHSGGRHVAVSVQRRGPWLEIDIDDDGAGVFETLRKGLGLPSARDALVQLEKGKVTTMPARHSGEGIFFTSKIAARFRLEAGALAWLVDNERDDRSIETVPHKPGTRVHLGFQPGHIVPYEEVFARFTDGADNRFAKTRVTIKLVDAGEHLISRSEAKRVAAGLERFEHVTLDFHGVTHVGQGFVDELFRVFALAHPGTLLEPARMNDAVAFMVTRAAVPSPSSSSPSSSSSRMVPKPALADIATSPFLSMKPERFTRALARVQSAVGAEAQLIAAAQCARALLRLHDDGHAQARLVTCFTKKRAAFVLNALRADRALARLDAVDADAASPSAREAVSVLLAHVAHTPVLWRHFVDDDAMDRFWAQSPEERRAVWGPPLA